ncbi:MAG: aldo/keto reductase [Actinobacteria bacterium]|nr:aldo/keto reductase [Actinomycetota bacterium]MBV8396962.1 aldo/keto reductase [Actinomycetota bacterium]MBV8597318.1 aldo/keto reductase [Actinomycetota bacterium]
MRTRTLGDTGLVVSVVGLGTNNFGWRIDDERAKSVVDAALDAGVTFFDTAEMYGDGVSEELLGRALGERRRDVVVATKFGWTRGTDPPGGSREYIRGAIEGSLRRLGTDYVDLYQYHRPDGVTPIEETLGALDELVQEGKVRHVGSSNFSADRVEEAAAVSAEHGWSRFVSAQNHYSLLERGVEDDLVPVCERLGIGVIPYYPLENGLLTGKYSRDERAPEGTRLAGRGDLADDRTWDRIEALESFAAERGVTLLDVAIGGLAAKPAVASVIAGATKPEQVRANAAAGEWVPSDADLQALSAI